MYPVIIQSPANTLAEVRFAGVPLDTFTPILQCADAMGMFRVCPAQNPVLLDSDSWHLVELRLEGAGTPQARCRAAVNGVEFCGQATNWTGLEPNSAFIGLCAVDEAWTGAMTMDELRVVSGPQGSRLRINGPDAGNQGECLRFTIDTVDSFSQQPAPVATHTAIDNVAFMGASAFFASNCSSPSGPPELSPTEPVWEVYARAGPSDISITANSADLIAAAPFTVHITRIPSDAGAPDAGAPDAGAPDAGAPDAGPPDAGALDAGALDAGALDAGALDAGPNPDAGLIVELDGGRDGGAGVTRPGDYDVGCGCTGAPLLQLLALIALLFRRSRR